MPNKKREVGQSAPEPLEDTGRPERDDAFPQGREDDDRARAVAGEDDEGVDMDDEFEDEDEFDDEEREEEE